jgi:short-subunit dehydrogenase
MGLRDELHGTGVGVTTVFPAFIAEAGMWADGGQDLPPGISLRRPEDVAKAVLRGIERNRGEVDVAPLPLRAMGWTASVAPAPVLALGRRMGSGDVAERLGEVQRDKR